MELPDLKAVKSQYRLFDVLMELIPSNFQQRNYGYARFFCPLHSDGSHGSLIVNERTDRCWCAGGGCTFNNQAESASVLDVVVELVPEASTLMEAALWLEGKDIEAKSPANTKPASKAKPRSMHEVMLMHKNWHLAKDYLFARGLNEASIKKHLIGVKKNHCMREQDVIRHGNWRYEVPRHPVNRISIPYIFGNNVRAIRLRRDDTDARQRMELMAGHRPYEIVKRYVERVLSQKKPSINAEQEVFEYLFGPKYITLGSTMNRIYNIEALLNIQSGRVEYRNIPHLVWVEGEFDAILVEQETALPAVADNRGSTHSKQAYQAVENLLLLRDAGQSGENIANRVLQRAERRLGQNAQIIHPLPGCKDVTDVYLQKHNLHYITGAIPHDCQLHVPER